MYGLPVPDNSFNRSGSNPEVHPRDPKASFDVSRPASSGVMPLYMP